jgi:hypothetical protein
VSRAGEEGVVQAPLMRTSLTIERALQELGQNRDHDEALTCSPLVQL